MGVRIVTPSRRTALFVALVVTAHPGPSLVISAIIIALAAAAGASTSHLLLLIPAAVAAQFSIGWSNDAFDAPNDTAAGRQDKPVARGTVSRRTIIRAALVALTVSVVFAFMVGPPTGVVNLAMIALGWTYNAGLKSSPLSGLLYVLGFGLIPVFSASVLDGYPLPRPWTVVVAGLLGLGAHFVNVLPDLADDLAHGVHGFPQLMAKRLGPFAVRLTAFALLLTASAVIVVMRRFGWVAMATFVVGLVLSLVGLRAPGRVPFLIAMAVAALDAALFVSTGNDLVDR